MNVEPFEFCVLCSHARALSLPGFSCGTFLHSIDLPPGKASHWELAIHQGLIYAEPLDQEGGVPLKAAIPSTPGRSTRLIIGNKEGKIVTVIAYSIILLYVFEPG